MIAVDTNILVRYFAEDDPLQSRKSRHLLETQATAQNPVFVSLVTLVELIWVLADCYQVGDELLAAIVAQLARAEGIELEQAALVEEALALPQGDLADRIIHLIGQHNGCSHTLTFDRKFARLEGVKLLA